MRKVSGKIFATLFAVLALTASLAAGVGAYFSDYETALGDVELHLNGKTEIEEKLIENGKVISVANTGNSEVVVRVAVYGPDDIEITLAKEDDWFKSNDGYYYYKKVLAPGESISDITALLKLTEDEAAVIGNQFDVVVVHESALAVYEFDEETDQNKVIAPENWDLPEISVKME